MKLVCIPYFSLALLSKGQRHIWSLCHRVRAQVRPGASPRSNPSLSAARKPLGFNNLGEGGGNERGEKRRVAARGYTPSTCKMRILERPLCREDVWAHNKAPATTAVRGADGQQPIPNWPGCQEPPQGQKRPSTTAGSWCGPGAGPSSCCWPVGSNVTTTYSRNVPAVSQSVAG